MNKGGSKLIYNTSELKKDLSIEQDMNQPESGLKFIGGLFGEIFMNNSQLIVFTYKEPLYCCCYVEESLMACSSNKTFILWDFAQGRMIVQYRFDNDVAPVSVTAINESQDMVRLYLQLKQTKVIIFAYDKVGKNMIRLNDYQLEMIGFTKLSLATYNYDSEGNVQKNIDQHFFTIRYSNKIEKRAIITGKIEQQIAIYQTKFEQVNYLLTYMIQNITYFLVAEQGATFKQFILDKQSQIIEANNIKSLKTKAQVSIVLSIQPIQGFKAYICMRNQHIYIMNLKDLQIQQQLNFKSYRMIKSIPILKQQKIYAISTKNELSLLSNNIILSHQKIQKSFIMDIDTSKYGIIGVTQQGKILYFPLI